MPKIAGQEEEGGQRLRVTPKLVGQVEVIHISSTSRRVERQRASTRIAGEGEEGGQLKAKS